MFKAVLFKIALLEATQVPINKRMDKQTEIYSFNGILLSNKKNNQYTQQNTMPSEGSQYKIKNISITLKSSLVPPQGEKKDYLNSITEI